MLSAISFQLNNQKVTYTGNPSARLLDVLRSEYKLTGTKCGCLEGECGACSVIIDGKLRNSCLVAMGSLDGSAVTTIEGYSETERFTVLERSFASVSAVQCGFCIPGMILAAECLLAENPKPTESEIREAISGNLCRCTGYTSIVKAIGIASEKLAESSAAVGLSAVQVSSEFPETHELRVAELNVNYSASPASLREALSMFKSQNLIPYCGGTDLMVEDDCAEKDYLYIGGISELRQITKDAQYIRFGAVCTFTDVINHPLTPGILRDMCKQIAAPAIRNAGTLGGNLSNGSAKADAALVFMVTGSKLRIMSADGEREIAVKDFYLGAGRVDLNHGELITEILMPKSGTNNYYLKKVGARNALAISRVSFAGILDINDGRIINCATAFGAVTDTIIRFEHIDQMLIGKTVDEAKLLRGDYLAAYNEAIVPRRGRVGIEYRKTVCMNLLADFFDSKIGLH